MVRAAYLLMELTGWFVIVPLSFASLLFSLDRLVGGHDVSNQISVMPMAGGRLGNHGRGHMGEHGDERKLEPPR